MPDRALTNAQRARASEAKLLAAGGARMGMVLPPETAAALDALVNIGFATSRAGVIRRAIAEAHQRAKTPEITPN